LLPVGILSFVGLPSGLSLRVEDRTVTVRLRSLSLSKVEGSAVEPHQREREKHDG
jgi:hypothetical protein